MYYLLIICVKICKWIKMILYIILLNYRENYTLNEIIELLEPSNIGKLDINRMYKYLYNKI